MEEKYDYKTKIRGKNINFRKWKVKDKKKFLSNQDNQKIIREALVYDCLEDKTIALSDDEFKFMLFNIRYKSIPEPLLMEMECGECDEGFDLEIQYNDAVSVQGDDKYSEIEVRKHIFKMKDIKNRDFYEDMILNTEDPEEKKLIDFILHIDSYNDQDYDFDKMNEIIINLDVEDFEDIFIKWEKMRFQCNTISLVECPKCQYSDHFEFEHFPYFFPDSWGF